RVSTIRIDAGGRSRKMARPHRGADSARCTSEASWGGRSRIESRQSATLRRSAQHRARLRARTQGADVTTRAADLGLPESIALLPHDWPADGIDRPLLPGDLSQFAANRGVSKIDLTEFHPFRFDSKIHPGGGLTYFDELIGSDDLKTLLGI